MDRDRPRTRPLPELRTGGGEVVMTEQDPCKCGHDLIRHDMGHGCIECRCRGFREASPNELRSQLYAWLGDRTSQPDGDVWTHEQLMPAARDLAAFINHTLQGDDCD